MIRVTVWNEFRHEKSDETVRLHYPEGIHHALARALSKDDGLQVRTATLDEPEHGLTRECLAATDVLTWWGHKVHEEVSDEVVDRVKRRVLEGMGLIVLHSGHFSKVFKALMGTTCALRWRESGEKERLWCVEPSHPIAQGVGEFIDLPHSEMYGERFDIPTPEQVLFISWFEGGEVFRSGCTFQRGQGRVFYFAPGHETYPIYHNEQILRVIHNAVRWAGRRTR
jgi:trehalose utilization protein